MVLWPIFLLISVPFFAAAFCAVAREFEAGHAWLKYGGTISFFAYSTATFVFGMVIGIPLVYGLVHMREQKLWHRFDEGLQVYQSDLGVSLSAEEA